MTNKGKLIILGSFLQQLVALSWFTILQNDPSAYTQHTAGEWVVIALTSAVVLSLGVVGTVIGLLTNPNQTSLPPTTTTDTKPTG